MRFEERDFKELYIAKYGKELDWDKLNEFAQYICQEQKEDIIDDYRKHSTSMDGTEYTNRNFMRSVNAYSYDDSYGSDEGALNDDDQNIY